MGYTVAKNIGYGYVRNPDGVSRDFVRGCETPLLVLMGDDLYHPQVTSREVAELAPNAELLERWNDDAGLVSQTVARVRAFLEANTP